MNDDGDSCKVDQDIDDAFFVPGSAAGYFIARSFGGVWFSANGLTTAATKKPGGAGNGFEHIRRVACDGGNPNRQWAVTPGSGGFSYFSRTTDGWSTEEDWDIGNPAVHDLTNPYDVDFAGGSVLAAGSAGMILHSIDGATFFFDGADGALATQDWLSVGLASAAEGAVGGTGGKLVLTSSGQRPSRRDAADRHDQRSGDGCRRPASDVQRRARRHRRVRPGPGRDGVDRHRPRRPVRRDG